MKDIHCHILPGLDDGAETMGEALQMARVAADSGVRHIVCTPHCSTNDRDLGGRIKAIREAVDDLSLRLEEEGIPLRPHLGMELLCGGGLARVLERGNVLTLAGSSLLLIEFRFDTGVAAIERAVTEVRRWGYVPVLAHPERYPVVWEAPECLEIWADEGCLLQLDKDSVLGRFGRRCAAAAHWALRRGIVFAVASDAHDSEARSPELETAWAALEREFGPELPEQLMGKGLFLF